MTYKELKRFNPNLAIEAAPTPPYSWYTDQELFEAEKINIFEKSWIYVGRKDQLNKPGDYFTGIVAGNPFVVIVDENNELKAFHNICRHKAAEVAKEKGNCSELICPYHGWAYRLDGSLKRSPHMGKLCNFDVSQNGLTPISVQAWQNFVFIDLDGSWTEKDGDIRNLEQDIQPLVEPLVSLGIDKMRWVAQKSYDMKCNWKVFIDNGLDGGYHVLYAHEKLASGLAFDAYQTHIFDRSSYQICDANNQDSRLGNKVIYAWMYPNLFINRYGRCMDTNVVLPLTVDTCRVVIDWYFDYENMEDWATQKIVKNAISDSDVVQQEDIEVCESVQRGMNSMAATHGRYSSKLEKGVHAFHKILWKELT